jgi:predicted kinase
MKAIEKAIVNKLTIIRGIVGSGKSHYVAKLRQKENLSPELVCSADNFFMVNGVYVFDPLKLPQAHAACMKRFIFLLMVKKAKHIIVDNTNIHEWEFTNYRYLATLAGYKVEIVEFRVETISDVAICAGRNKHKVPQEIVWQMAMEFEPDSKAIVFPVVK